MLLSLTTNTTAALTSWSVSGHGVQTSNTVNCLLRPPLGTVLSKGCKERGVSWCCGNYCWLAFVLWCGYCSVSFQSFVLRHWCPQHQETTKERQGPTLGVSFTEVSVLQKRPSWESRLYHIQCIIFTSDNDCTYVAITCVP